MRNDLEFYERNAAEATRAYPNVRETLNKLRADGLVLGIGAPHDDQALASLHLEVDPVEDASIAVALDQVLNFHCVHNLPF